MKADFIVLGRIEWILLGGEARAQNLLAHLRIKNVLWPAGVIAQDCYIIDELDSGLVTCAGITNMMAAVGKLGVYFLVPVDAKQSLSSWTRYSEETRNMLQKAKNPYAVPLREIEKTIETSTNNMISPLAADMMSIGTYRIMGRPPSGCDLTAEFVSSQVKTILGIIANRRTRKVTRESTCAIPNKAAPPINQTASGISAQLHRVRIPTVEFQNASVDECLVFLSEMLRKEDRANPVLIARKLGKKSMPCVAKITFVRKDITAFQLLEEVARIADYKINVEDSGVFLLPIEKK